MFAAVEQASWWASNGASVILGAIIALGASVLVTVLQNVYGQWFSRRQAEAAAIKSLQEALARLLGILRHSHSDTNDDIPTTLEIEYLLERVRDEKSRSDVRTLLRTAATPQMDAARASGQKSDEDNAAFDELVKQYTEAQRALGIRYRKVT